MTQPKANLRNLRIIELSGVDRPCHAPATVALMKRAVDKEPTMIAKKSAMTSAVEGHQHLIYYIDEVQSGTTSYESSYVEGQSRDACTGHCHPWIRNADGSITIGESLGHSHDMGEMSASLAKTESPTTNNNPANTTHTKSTRTPQPKQGDAMKTIVLTEAQHAHYSKLSGDDAEAFLAKSFAERENVLSDIAKSDPVVYKTTSGIEIRKSHGDVALMLAKQADESAAQIAKQAADLAKRDEAIEKAEVRKLAADVLAGVAGDDDTHDYIVKSIRKGGGDAAMIDKALATLRSSKEFAKQAAKAKGFGGTEPSEGDAVVKFNTELATFAKNLGKPVAQATEAFLNTAEGAALYAATRQPQA